MKATAMVCDRLECVRVTVVSSDLPSNCWRCEFETPEDACVALEEVGILPVGETSYAVRNNFDNGVLLAQGELQHEDTLLAAGFWTEELWVVN